MDELKEAAVFYGDGIYVVRVKDGLDMRSVKTDGEMTLREALRLVGALDD